MGIGKTRANQEALLAKDQMDMGVEELDAVVESITRLSKPHQHPTLEMLMNNVPFGVLLLDTELKLLGANKAYESFFDSAVAFAPGTPIHMLLPRAEECGVVMLLRRALDRGRSVRVKNFCYDGFSRGITYWNGSAIPVRLTAQDGPHDAVAMVVLEITDEILAREQLANYAILAERRATETELERSRLNAVIEAVPIPLIVCDAQRRITAYNSAACKLYESMGLNALLDSGRQLGNSCPLPAFNDNGQRIAQDQCPLHRSLRGEVCRDVVVNCRPSSPHPPSIMCINSAPLVDSNGKITGAVATLSDITQQRQAQELIEESYEREHAIATRLQETFLACDLPEMEGFECDKAYHTAKDACMVGGDFYDIFSLKDGNYAIVMGDVAGKGLKSAVYTAMTKYILRAYALEQSDPQLTLARLNEALSACTPSEVFVTLVYGILNTRDHTFTYANAGHEHPLLLRADDGQIHMLEVTGRALALLEGSTYTTHVVDLAPGDVIVFYTDGITDAGSGSNRLGQERLMQLLQSHGSGSLNGLISSVVGTAQKFAGGVLGDDAALLVIKAL